jgi:hypothetical protein
MGVNNGSKMVNKATVASLAELSAILRHRCQLRNAMIPTLDVDAQWLWRKFCTLKDGPIPGIKTFATHFLSHGVKLTIVDDGPSRHHSKKATILRDDICEQARIDSILLQAGSTV